MATRTWLHRLQTGLIMVALIAFVFAHSVTGYRAQAAETTDISSLLNLSLAYYEQERPELTSWWDVVALKSAGVDLQDGRWALPD